MNPADEAQYGKGSGIAPGRPRRATGIALIDRSSSAEIGRLLRGLALLWCIGALPIAFLTGLEMNGLMVAITLFLTPFYYIARKELDGFGLMAAMAFFLVPYVPAITLVMAGDARPVSIILISLPWLALAEHLARRIAGPATQVARASGASAQADVLMIAIFLLIAVVGGSLPEETSNADPVFLSFFGLALFHLDRLIAARQFQWIGLGLFALGILGFAFFIWTGFGRLLLGAFAAMPLLIFLHYQERRPGPLLVGTTLPVMLVFSQWVRDDEISSRGVSTSSMSSPNEIAVRLLANIDLLTVRWSTFWDQLSFFYLAWVPRGWWPEKPLGLGLTIVDDLFGRLYLPDDHSEAPGVVGEALWTFGPYAVIGLIAILAAYLTISVTIRTVMPRPVSGTAIQLALFPTLVWGGMASFASRLWLLLLPLLIYGLAVSLIERRRRS